MLQKQTSSQSDGLTTEATQDDSKQIASFLNQDNKIHRHLDWFSALEWLGTHPFLIKRKDNAIQAVLCTTPENEHAAWVRVFGVRKDLPPKKLWNRLLPKAIQELKDSNRRTLAALALHPWFEALLVDSGFVNRQDIIVLEWQGNLSENRSQNNDILIRRMVIEDLAMVQYIDQLAFSPIWQNSLASLTKAFKQTGISTVALINNQIVGYQISTSMTIYGHLARLAVHPDYQRQGIGKGLVFNLLKRFENLGLSRVTVNTQSDNKPSLNLYKQFNFRPTSENIRVYETKL
ncbi:MAG: GNAT family N-acetyltransferase [Chloroflexota bacterium]|jgi:ribosomal protein S18 acetylase RimI-like enzyme|nr:GNAT family N-acetyltransferase [Chloroflexota bacterium]